MSESGTSFAPTTGGAVAAIAALTLKRFLRSKAVYVAGAMGLLTLIPLLISKSQSDNPARHWSDFLQFAAYMQLLVAAMLTAPIIAEEIEDKTYAYLWSRPIPRWTVFIGKLFVGASIAALIMSVGITIGNSMIDGMSSELPRAVLAIVLGVFVTGSVAACFGTLLPKHPLAVSLAYFMVLDFGIGAMPFALARISVMHNVVALAGIGEHAGTTATSMLWLLGVGAFATVITLRRLVRKELSTGS